MKEGDTIEWRGVNKTHRGKIVKSDLTPEGYIIQMDNGHTFRLKDFSNLNNPTDDIHRD